MATAPAETYTIEDFISSGTEVTISYNNLSYLEVLQNSTSSPIYNVINDYIDNLKDLSFKVELSDSQYNKYIYKPKLLCENIYGNGEIYFIILLLNNIADVKQFNRKIILLPSKSTLQTFLSFIYNTEKDLIDQYNLK